MSEIFEGIITSGSLGPACEWARSEGVQAVAEELNGNTVVYRVDSRDDFRFSEKTERLAARMSAATGVAVVVRYDSRTSYRASVAYRSGQMCESFGPDDELFVPLDDDGEPVRHARPLKLSDLSPEEEYETVTNAIELGLRHLDGPSWNELRSFIASR